MRRISITLAIALIVSVIGPAAAGAQDNSAIDQYTEEVPSAGGGGQGDGSGDGSSGGGSGAPSDVDDQSPVGSGGGVVTASGDGGSSQAGSDGAANGAGASDGSNPSSDYSGAGTQTESDAGLSDLGSSVTSTPANSSAEPESGGTNTLLLILGAAGLLAAALYALMRWLRQTGRLGSSGEVGTS